MPTTAPKPGQDILGLAVMESLPEIKWEQGDDLCDCTFQRIGSWTNPYIARTLRVRFCCLWAELYKIYPQYVQEVLGYYNGNTGQYETAPAKWDSEDDDMPRAIWYRQLAVERGLPLEAIRQLYENETPPKSIKKVK